jgi:hypothetical protein
MRLILTNISVWILAVTVARAGEVQFTTKPAATKDGDKVKISFAVSAPTDVAVFVENAQGRIVRHLVAGVLGGANPPPEPLKPGLSQTVEWDGKADYDKPAEGGPFKVRVALGLGAKYDKVLSSRPLSFAGACALGAGPDGTLYLRHQYMPSVWHHTQVIALNRDGTYRRTLLPFASTADGAEAKGFDTMQVGGRPAPAGRDGGERDVFSGVFGPSYSSLAVSPDGKDIYGLSGSAGVMRLAAAGGCPQSPLVAMFERDKNGLGKEPVFAANAYAAVSSDGKRLFVNGLSNRYAKDALAAVYVLKLPERTGLEIFFGDPKAAGSDQAHLGAAPGGLECDGKGNLLVADPVNNRVLVLAEADGKLKGELKVETPSGVGVDRRSGAVYVTGREKNTMVRLAKFGSWQDAKPAGEVQLRRKGWAPNHSMAVDASADPVVIWVSAGGDGHLLRVEDRGGKFEIGEISADWRGGQTQECYLGVVVDRKTKEVYARNGGCGGLWERFSDETGKAETVRLPGDCWGTGGGTGFQVSPAPNGYLYAISWEHRFLQLDRAGKPVPWAERRMPSDEELKCYEYAKTASKATHESYVPVAMGELPHTLGVRWGDGHLFVIEPYLFSKWCGGRTFKALHEYLPTGKRVTTLDGPIIWKLSDAVVGPKFDAAGNIYVAEFVRPKGWYYPPEVKAYLDAKGITKLEGKAAGFTALYGSILKFSPKGGMVHWAKGPGPGGTSTGGEAWLGPDAFEGQPKLDPGLKTTDVEFFSWGQIRPMKVTGAEWVHPGIGNVGMFRCNCENVTFEVDEFGRTFYPDMCGFRVGVIDTAGNAITKIGGYGNPENCGPDSPVIDPKTGQPRPRRADDPKDLKSPFAEPEIAVAWPAGVGATDKHLYIGDASNRRLLRCKLVYAAEESCGIGNGPGPQADAGPIPIPKSEPAAGSPPPAAAGRSPEQVCAGWFSSANTYRSAGLKDEARRCLNNILRDYPGTTQAARAREEIAKL